MSRNRANLAKFQKALAKQPAKLMDDFVRDVQLAVGQHVYERVIMRTPVLTGHARHNWRPEVNTQAESEVEGVYGGDTTGDPITADERARWSEVRKSLRALPVGQTIWICNNAPYIGRLEFGGYPPGPGTIDGFSKKAPHGMVGITLREVLEGVYQQQPRMIDDSGT